MNSNEIPGLADSLRQLAAIIDENPEIVEWFHYPSIGAHKHGHEGAAFLVAFEKIFSAKVRHPEGDGNSGISSVSSKVGVVDVWLQVDTADYLAAEKAGDTE
jgi:hypothetical protein